MGSSPSFTLGAFGEFSDSDVVDFIKSSVDSFIQATPPTLFLKQEWNSFAPPDLKDNLIYPDLVSCNVGFVKDTLNANSQVMHRGAPMEFNVVHFEQGNELRRVGSFLNSPRDEKQTSHCMAVIGLSNVQEGHKLLDFLGTPH
jgi:hypothetical protein